jgi:hypothetical protein
VLVGMSEKVFPDIVETANIQKLWEGSSASEAVYTFNKDFELTGISCSVGSATDAATDDAAAGSESGSETGAFPGGTAYAIDVTYAIDGYGTVDPASVAVPQGVRNSSIDINEALAKAKSLAGEVVDKVGDFVGGLKDDLAERAREGIDQVSTYLENVDASELIDKFSSVVSDAA